MSAVRAPLRVLTLRDLVPVLTNPELPPEKRMVYYEVRSHRRVASAWGAALEPHCTRGPMCFVHCPPSGAGAITGPRSPVVAVEVGDGLIALGTEEPRGGEAGMGPIMESEAAAGRRRGRGAGGVYSLTGREMGIFSQGTSVVKRSEGEATALTGREVGLFSKGAAILRRTPCGAATAFTGREMGLFSQGSPVIRRCEGEATTFTGREVGLLSRGRGVVSSAGVLPVVSFTRREAELFSSSEEVMFPLFTARELRRLATYPETWAEGALLTGREVDLFSTCWSAGRTTVGVLCEIAWVPQTERLCPDALCAVCCLV